MKSASKWVVLGAVCVWAGLMTGCESNSDPASSLGISPVSVYLAAGKVSMVTFTASGGDGSYTWSVDSTNLGEIFIADEAAIYKSTTNAGVNTVLVTDGNSDQASAVVTQE